MGVACISGILDVCTSDRDIMKMLKSETGETEAFFQDPVQLEEADVAKIGRELKKLGSKLESKKRNNAKSSSKKGRSKKDGRTRRTARKRRRGREQPEEEEEQKSTCRSSDTRLLRQQTETTLLVIAAVCIGRAAVDHLIG